MIVVEDLVVRLGGFTLRIPRLEVVKGEYLVVMGPSGVGKTVFLHTLAGFLTPSKGRILVNGVDVTRYPPERRGFAIIPQDYGLFPHMSVHDNIAYGLRVRGVSKGEARSRVLEVSRALGIEHLLSRRPGSLSSGEKQRVALARALVVEPEVLLMDEPLSNLDPRLRASARAFIKGLRFRVSFTAIHVTHDIAEAIDLGDRVAYMEGGLLVGVYSPKDFLKTPYARPYISSLEPVLKVLGAGKRRNVLGL
ncbi:MAG: molybdenum ABC transporter ATP-binding protein [Desulfurococcales archaeon ex4484_204]|nr:MAG: molybdenum ABC transporter ATP-binding protein [Desulfurococcales archaeon ex4484_204]